jgi:hypothetical protein
MRTGSEADRSPPVTNAFRYPAIPHYLHVLILTYAQEQFHISKAPATELTKQTPLLGNFNSYNLLPSR